MKQGEKLRLLLKEKKLTQYEFAEAIEESLSQINKVLNGHRNVSSAMIEKIVGYFPEIDLNWFLKDDITIRSMVNEEGDTYLKQSNPTQILQNMEEEIKALKSILPQK